MWMTLSDAFRIMLTGVAREKTLPFKSLVPTGKTIQAMQDARGVKMKSFKIVDDLMADLNAEG